MDDGVRFVAGARAGEWRERKSRNFDPGSGAGGALLHHAERTGCGVVRPVDDFGRGHREHRGRGRTRGATRTGCYAIGEESQERGDRHGGHAGIHDRRGVYGQQVVELRSPRVRAAYL